MSYSDQIRAHRGCPTKNIYQGDAPRILFVCTMGLLRSATMATMAAQRGINARCCGMDASALIPITETLIEWADEIVFADAGHKAAALERFPDWDVVKRARVWSVPDVYEYMNPALVKILTLKFDALPGASVSYAASTEDYPEDSNAG